MNTHILIPIYDIEESIANIDVLIKKGGFKHYYEGKKDALEYLLKHHVQGKPLYKRISLDEKDIEKKAVKNSMGYDAQSVAIDCYKQALKDLL